MSYSLYLQGVCSKLKNGLSQILSIDMISVSQGNVDSIDTS